jgi:hypothetical protein
MKITHIGSCMVFGSKTAANQPSTNIKDQQNIWVQCVLVQVYSNVLATNAKQGSPIQNLLWPNFKAELTSSVNSALRRERGFSHTIPHGSQDTGEINFVVSSITMYNMWCILWHMLYIKIGVWS